MDRCRSKGYDLTALEGASVYGTEGLCPLCGEEADTIDHRLWSCPNTAELRAASFTHSEMQELLSDEMQLERTGWVRAPVPKREHSMEVYFESEMFEDALSMAMAMQTLCVDSSCNMEVHHLSFRTSAWTCVAYNAQEEEIGLLTGPVWKPVHASSGPRSSSSSMFLRM